jgi:hypothetical protein
MTTKKHQPRPDPSVTERWLVAFARASVMSVTRRRSAKHSMGVDAESATV